MPSLRIVRIVEVAHQQVIEAGADGDAPVTPSTDKPKKKKGRRGSQEPVRMDDVEMTLDGR